MIWNLRSQPELGALSDDEVKLLMREAGEAKSVRKSSLIGLMLCGLCAGEGALMPFPAASMVQAWAEE